MGLLVLLAGSADPPPGVAPLTRALMVTPLLRNFLSFLTSEGRADFVAISALTRIDLWRFWRTKK